MPRKLFYLPLVGKIIEGIDQKTVIPFIYIAISLIGFDILITSLGIKLGMEETNFITLMFMKRFGNLYGMILSMAGKTILVISPLLVYPLIEKYLETNLLKKIYWILFTILSLLAIITTLITDIKNIISIIDRVQYIDYIHTLV